MAAAPPPSLNSALYTDPTKWVTHGYDYLAVIGAVGGAVAGNTGAARARAMNNLAQP